MGQEAEGGGCRPGGLCGYWWLKRQLGCKVWQSQNGWGAVGGGQKRLAPNELRPRKRGGGGASGSSDGHSPELKSPLILLLEALKIVEIQTQLSAVGPTGSASNPVPLCTRSPPKLHRS